MVARRSSDDAEIRAFIEAAPVESTYSELVKQIINRFGAARAWSREEIVRYCFTRRAGLPWQRCKIEADPQLYAFIDDRLWRMSLDGILSACRATFGPERVPSRSALGRYAIRRKKQLGL